MQEEYSEKTIFELLFSGEFRKSSHCGRFFARRGCHLPARCGILNKICATEGKRYEIHSGDSHCARRGTGRCGTGILTHGCADGHGTGAYHRVRAGCFAGGGGGVQPGKAADISAGVFPAEGGYRVLAAKCGLPGHRRRAAAHAGRAGLGGAWHIVHARCIRAGYGRDLPPAREESARALLCACCSVLCAAAVPRFSPVDGRSRDSGLLLSALRADQLHAGGVSHGRVQL